MGRASVLPIPSFRLPESPSPCLSGLVSCAPPGWGWGPGRRTQSGDPVPGIFVFLGLPAGSFFSPVAEVLPPPSRGGARRVSMPEVSLRASVSARRAGVLPGVAVDRARDRFWMMGPCGTGVSPTIPSERNACSSYCSSRFLKQTT